MILKKAIFFSDIIYFTAIMSIVLKLNNIYLPLKVKNNSQREAMYDILSMVLPAQVYLGYQEKGVTVRKGRHLNLMIAMRNHLLWPLQASC